MAKGTTNRSVEPSKHLSSRQIQAALDEFAKSQDLRDGPYRLRKRAWLGMFRVPPGVVLVAVYDGDYERPELLEKGPYHPLAFPIQQQVDLYAVNVRQLQYVIPSRQEYELLHRPAADMPVTPVPVRLEIMVTLQVMQPEPIALEIQNPIAELEGYVVNAVRRIICSTELEDFIAGEVLTTVLLAQIEQGDCEQRLGIRVLGVQIVDMKIDESILRLARAHYTAVTEAQAAVAAKDILNASELRWKKDQMRYLGLAGLDGAAPQLLTHLFTLLQELARTNPTEARVLMKDLKGVLVELGGESDDVVHSLPSRAAHSIQPLSGLAQLQNDREQLEVMGIAMKVGDWGDIYLVELQAVTPGGNQIDIFAQAPRTYPQEAAAIKVKVNGAQVSAAWEAGMTFVSFVCNLRNEIG